MYVRETPFMVLVLHSIWYTVHAFYNFFVFLLTLNVLKVTSDRRSWNQSSNPLTDLMAGWQAGWLSGWTLTSSLPFSDVLFFLSFVLAIMLPAAGYTITGQKVVFFSFELKL